MDVGLTEQFDFLFLFYYKGGVNYSDLNKSSKIKYCNKVWIGDVKMGVMMYWLLTKKVWDNEVNNNIYVVHSYVIVIH
jgi:hypothetical protein